jgi:hypothetical protein
MPPELPGTLVLRNLRLDETLRAIGTRRKATPGEVAICVDPCGIPL